MATHEPATSSTSHPVVRAWLLDAQRAGTHGPVMVRRSDASNVWVLALRASASAPDHLGTTPLPTRCTDGPYPQPATRDVTGLLTEAVGFQLSHRLRSPLSQLAGHQALALRALEHDDPGAARGELTAAAAMVDGLLADAQGIAETIADVLRGLHGVPRTDAASPAPAQASALLAGIRAVPRPAPGPSPEAPLALGASGQPGSVLLIHLPDADPGLAGSVARLAWTLSTALHVTETLLLVGGPQIAVLDTYPTAHAREQPPRVVASEDPARQAFVLGRTLATASDVGIVPVASALGALLSAGGRVLHAHGIGTGTATPAAVLAASCSELALLDRVGAHGTAEPGWPSA